MVFAESSSVSIVPGRDLGFFVALCAGRADRPAMEPPLEFLEIRVVPREEQWFSSTGPRADRGEKFRNLDRALEYYAPSRRSEGFDYLAPA